VRRSLIIAFLFVTLQASVGLGGVPWVELAHGVKMANEGIKLTKEVCKEVPKVAQAPTTRKDDESSTGGNEGLIVLGASLLGVLGIGYLRLRDE
jgi:hypothetical protein